MTRSGPERYFCTWYLEASHNLYIVWCSSKEYASHISNWPSFSSAMHITLQVLGILTAHFTVQAIRIMEIILINAVTYYSNDHEALQQRVHQGHELFWCLCPRHWTHKLTFLEIPGFVFLHRLRWEDRCHFHVSPLKMKLQPEAGVEAVLNSEL